MLIQLSYCTHWMHSTLPIHAKLLKNTEEVTWERILFRLLACGNYSCCLWILERLAATVWLIIRLLFASCIYIYMYIYEATQHLNSLMHENTNLMWNFFENWQLSERVIRCDILVYITKGTIQTDKYSIFQILAKKETILNPWMYQNDWLTAAIRWLNVNLGCIQKQLTELSVVASRVFS